MNSMQEMFDASFNRQVEELRLKIDSLPSEQQPHLLALLEATRQQHDEMRQSSLQVRAFFEELLTSMYGQKQNAVQE
jgi:DNA anti-recombination protein RmuC